MLLAVTNTGSDAASGQPVPPACGKSTGKRPQDRTEDQAGRQERDRIHRFQVASGAFATEGFVAAHVEMHRVGQPPREQGGAHQPRAESEGRSDQYQCPHMINFAYGRRAVTAAAGTALECRRAPPDGLFPPSPARNRRTSPGAALYKAKSVLTTGFSRDAAEMFFYSTHSAQTISDTEGSPRGRSPISFLVGSATVLCHWI